MKISLFIHNINHLIGGAENATLVLCSALLAAGHDAEIVILDRIEGEPYFVTLPTPRIVNLHPNPTHTLANKIPIVVHRLNDNRLIKARKWVQCQVPLLRKLSFKRNRGRYTTRFNQYLQDRNPDLIISMMPAITSAISLCKAANKIPKIFVCHTEPYRDFGLGKRNIRERIDGLNLVDALRSFHASVVLTEAFVEQIDKHVNHPVYVIPNSLDEQRFAVKATTDATPRKNEVVFAGRLDEIKRLPLLLQAWKQVTLKMPDWQLKIIGEGSVRQELQDYIDANGLKHSCKLLGKQRELAAHLSTAKLCCMPSRTEGHSVAMIEAMSCGAPGIAINDCSGLVELIGDCGFIAKDPTPKCLADTMIDAMSDEKKIARLSHLAEQKSRHYRISETLKLWEKMFAQVCSCAAQ